jgi:2'-phosphotransferase
MGIGLPGKDGCISGMRSSCEVVVEVNINKAAISGKIPIFISENSVILTPGAGN